MILPIKKKWYDMILSGEKKEEYREIKPYYTTRFKHLWQGSLIGGKAEREIIFRNGYSKTSPSFTAMCTIDVGTGKIEWGATQGETYYILHIVKILKCSHYDGDYLELWPNQVGQFDNMTGSMNL